MEILSTTFSSLLYGIFFLFIFWGIYIIRLDPKGRLNQGFLLLCLSLSFWAFGFAAANNQSSIEIAIIMRRISALGWTSFYSILLHFLVLMTREKAELKYRRVLYLLHIPSLILMYVYSFSNSFSTSQYQLVQVPFGWVNITQNNRYSFIFYAYYTVYMVISLILVWNWSKHTKGKSIKKQSRYIFIALLSAVMMGSLSDIWLNVFLTTHVPQLGPLVFLIPMGAIYHAARYYGLFGVSSMAHHEEILTREDQKRVFLNISFVYILGGIFLFLSEIIPLTDVTATELYPAIIKTFIVMMFGVILALTQWIKGEKAREILNSLILLFSIPVITFMYIDRASINVWVIPIIVMVSSLVFNKKFLLISSMVMGVITQRIIWTMKPSTIVIINDYDFIFRIGLLLLAFLLSMYVNQTYVARLRDIAYQVSFQKINSEISSDFISINRENFHEKVHGLLTKMGEFFHADRTYLFIVDHENKTMTYSHEWCNEGIPEEVETIKDVPLEVFPWWISELENKKMVYIMDVFKMPPEAIEEQNQLIRQNVKSLISVPVEGKGQLQGFIGIDAVNEWAKWTYDDIKLFKILANLLSSGLTKIKAEEEIAFRAYYDQLTGLPNRALLEKCLDQRIAEAKRDHQEFSVIFIDIDSFKMVNDSIGHKGGDELLVEVAKRIKTLLGDLATIARFGGDEFLILLDSLESKKEVGKKAKELMDAFIRPFTIQEQDFYVTCSAGIATYPEDGVDAENLIKNADTAMYSVKYSGKNQFAFCTAKMKEDVYAEMKLSNDLNMALENKELMVYYQPQVNVSTGEITGMEALLRWNHPTLGMVPPQVFIPLAEKVSLINKIGSYVLKEACETNKHWQEQELCYIPIAVNLSGMQFINQQVIDQIKETLLMTGLESKYLEVEITESTAITQSDQGLDLLDQLKGLGVSIAIDDFGTEYSSLSRLQILPIDRIKIDMQFVQGIGKSQKDEAITTVIINLAKSLQLDVIAEGVETYQQMAFLKRNHCDDVQGYYFYKPMKREDMDVILRKEQQKKILDEKDIF